jgi:hypothetical protein
MWCFLWNNSYFFLFASLEMLGTTELVLEFWGQYIYMQVNSRYVYNILNRGKTAAGIFAHCFHPGY